MNSETDKIQELKSEKKRIIDSLDEDKIADKVVSYRILKISRNY